MTQEQTSANAKPSEVSEPVKIETGKRDFYIVITGDGGAADVLSDSRRDALAALAKILHGLRAIALQGVLDKLIVNVSKIETYPGLACEQVDKVVLTTHVACEQKIAVLEQALTNIKLVLADVCIEDEVNVRIQMLEDTEEGNEA